jgi:hypothetical protein
MAPGMIRTTSALALTFFVSLGSLGCKPKGPCTGGGMVVDERELAPTLKELGAPGKGAYCRAESSTEPNSTHRHYEITDHSPSEMVDAWNEHMTDAGWRDITPFDTLARNLEEAHAGEGCGMFESVWAKDGVSDRVTVSVSFCAEMGWSNLSLVECKPGSTTDICQSQS